MKLLFYMLLIGGLFCSCQENPVPKPRGYFKIELPDRGYNWQETDCPFEFEIPVYSRFQKRIDKGDECWFNIDFPKFKAQVHFTYKPVNNNIATLIEESHSISYEHLVKANDILQLTIKNDSTCVYGLLYRLDGEVATPLQIYLTDSVNHFLRGSMYFNCPTNSDSLRPVVDFLEVDVMRLANSLNWSTSNCNR